MALSCAMLASTSWPRPVVSVSDSFWVKVPWIENFFAPALSLARAEFTFVSEAWRVAISVEALACVEIVAVLFRVTMVPYNFRVCDAVVMRRVPSEDARAVIWVVEPSTRLMPLKIAFFTIVAIWSRSATKS